MMKIIVCLKEVIDPKLNLDFGLTNRIIFRESRPFKLDPGDTTSLAFALNLKSSVPDPQIEITVVSIGPERVESYLRDGLALGADKAVRIWDKDCEVMSPYIKARLLTALISILGSDLVFTGTQSLDTGNGQVGTLVATWMGWPCVTEVRDLELGENIEVVHLVKEIGHGKCEKIHCRLPAVITIKGEKKLQYASLDKIIDCKYAEIKVFSTADLGIPPELLKGDLSTVTDVLFPRPAPVKVPQLDSSLPAFYRILQLLQGGITRRKGLILQGSSQELAEQLFILLKEEGVIKPAVNP